MKGNLVAAVALTTLLFAPSVTAQEKRSVSDSGKAFIAVSESAPLEAKRVSAELAMKAASSEGARVIVQISLPQPFQAEGRLPPQALGRQRQAIANAQENLLNALAGFNADNYSRYTTIPAMAFRVDSQALAALESSPLITVIQEDVAVPPTLASSTNVINAPETWAEGIDGTGQSVVILDTGIDGDHAFFNDAGGSSRIVAEACFSNAGGDGGETSLCPNGNSSQTGTGSAEAKIAACLDGSNNQLCHHGTHVAGIAAGNGSSFDGVARNADIIAIQVFTRFEDETTCGGANRTPCVLSYNSDQIAALDYINSTLYSSHTIASVNMSLGGGKNTSHCDLDSRKDVIDNLVSKDIATVIATGNDGFTDGIGTPSCISTSVAVSSTTDADGVSSFSNVADIMDLFAPGSGIDSSIVGGGYARFNGTSMAAPHVAGAFAALKQAAPNATVGEILHALSRTGVSVTDSRVGGSETKPRIDLKAALDQLAPTSPHTWSPGSDPDWHNAGNWSQGTVPDCNTDVFLPSSTTPPTVASDAVARQLTVQDGVHFVVEGQSLRLCGDVDVQGTATLTMANAELILDGTQASTMTLTASSQLHDLRIGNGIYSKIITLTSAVVLTGDLTVAQPSFLQPAGNTLVFEGGDQSIDLHSSQMTVANHDFSSTDGWSVLDANEDEVTWVATSVTNAPNSPDSGQHGRYRWNTDGQTAADDWLFSPGTSLIAGITYQISFNYGARSADWPEKMTVGLGTNNTPAGMTTTLFSSDSITNETWATETVTFTPTTSDTYFVGFHARSDADRFELAVDALLVQTSDWALSSLSIASGSRVNITNAPTMVIDGTFSNDGVFDLGAATLKVVGSFSNTGRLSATKPVSNGATTQLLRITDPGGAIKHGGVEITPDGSDLGITTAHVDAGSDCTTNRADALFRSCFDLTPTHQSSATVRFWQSENLRNGVDASASEMLHWNGSAWEDASSISSQTRSAAGTSCDQVDGRHCWFEASAVSSYSPFVVGTSASGAPTGTTHTVTPSASSNGSISPNTAQAVNHGDTIAFTVTPNTGYSASLGGSCGGSLSGNTYTTNAIIADCTVEASFSLNSYTVTPSAGSNGTISPATAQAVNHGDTIAFTVTPNTGYSASVGGSCGGSLSGNTYTTNAITADCTVEAGFSSDSYSVSITVSDLQGDYVTLQNNGGDDLIVISNASHQFDTLLSDGDTYEVTVLRQPTSPPQVCEPSDASGRIDGASVDNIEVQCVSAEVSLSYSSLRFKVNQLGEVASIQWIDISNNGGATLELGSILLTGTDPSSFSIVSQDCANRTLEIGESCRVELDFDPQDGRWYFAKLDINSSDIDSPHSVTLDGVVIQIFRDRFEGL